jgi:hypothetical protein
MPNFLRYTHTTQKFTLTFLAVYFTLLLNGQSWTWIDKEPLSGQVSLLQALDSDEGQLLAHGFQNKIIWSTNDIFEPKGEQDLIFSFFDKTGVVKWNTVLYNKGVATISAIHWEQSRNEWLISGVFWDTLFVQNQTVVLPAVNKCLFLLCLDGKDGGVKWISPVGGEGGRWSGGVCTTAQSYYFTGTFTGQLDFGSLPSLQTSRCGAFLIELDQNGVPVQSTLIGEGEDIRLYRSVLNNHIILHGGSFRGDVHFQSWSDEGRLQDQELLLVQTDLSGNVDWLRSGKGVGDDVLSDMQAAGQGRWIVGGSFSGNMRFTPEFNLRSLGSLSDGFLLLLDSTGIPVDARVYSNSGSFQAQQISKVESFWALNGTFDGTLFLAKGNLQSPGQSRSGVSLLWNIERSADSSIFYPIDNGLMSYVFLSARESTWLYTNFIGNLTLDTVNWTSDAFRTWRWKQSAMNIRAIEKDFQRILVYPNPFWQDLYLNETVLEIQIWQLDGTKVLQHVGNTPLRLHQLHSGMYIAKIRNSDGWRVKMIYKR